MLHGQEVTKILGLPISGTDFWAEHGDLWGFMELFEGEGIEQQNKYAFCLFILLTYLYILCLWQRHLKVCYQSIMKNTSSQVKPLSRIFWPINNVSVWHINFKRHVCYTGDIVSFVFITLSPALKINNSLAD